MILVLKIAIFAIILAMALQIGMVRITGRHAASHYQGDLDTHKQYADRLIGLTALMVVVVLWLEFLVRGSSPIAPLTSLLSIHLLAVAAFVGSLLALRFKYTGFRYRGTHKLLIYRVTIPAYAVMSLTGFYLMLVL